MNIKQMSHEKYKEHVLKMGVLRHRVHLFVQLQLILCLYSIISVSYRLLDKKFLVSFSQNRLSNLSTLFTACSAAK
jgi:hypothetical protein